MSIPAMNWVWQHSQAGGTDRLVLLAIADNANDDGDNAWPSLATIARKANVNERTVRRSITWLVGAGELVIVSRGTGHHSTRYKIIMRDPRDEGGQTVPPPRRGKGRQPARPGGTNSPPRAGTRVHRTSLNPTEPSSTSSAGADGGVETAKSDDKATSPPPRADGVKPTTERETVVQATNRTNPEKPIKPRTYPALPAGTSINEAFREFYDDVYPRKVARNEAIKAFEVVMRRKDVQLAEVLAGARRYRDDPHRDPSYTAHPASWLRGGRWGDDPLPPRGEQGRRSVSQDNANLLETMKAKYGSQEIA